MILIIKFSDQLKQIEFLKKLNDYKHTKKLGIFQASLFIIIFLS